MRDAAREAEERRSLGQEDEAARRRQVSNVQCLGNEPLSFIFALVADHHRPHAYHMLRNGFVRFALWGTISFSRQQQQCLASVCDSDPTVVTHLQRYFMPAVFSWPVALSPYGHA